MITEEIKKLLMIKDEDDNYYISSKDVAEFHGMSLNSVYSSRERHPTQLKKKEYREKKGLPFVTDKLYKLYAFERLKQILLEQEKKELSIQGNKAGVLNGLNSILDDDKKYKIVYEEIVWVKN